MFIIVKYVFSDKYLAKFCATDLLTISPLLCINRLHTLYVALKDGDDDFYCQNIIDAGLYINIFFYLSLQTTNLKKYLSDSIF